MLAQAHAIEQVPDLGDHTIEDIYATEEDEQFSIVPMTTKRTDNGNYQVLIQNNSKHS